MCFSRREERQAIKLKSKQAHPSIPTTGTSVLSGCGQAISD
jgi:hypothetical protein